jgi:predicted NBD/HSP70 family sugar kinase
LVVAAGKPPLGIGIGTSGLVDTATGTVRWAVHLDWRDLGLGARVSGRTGLPVYVANDSQAAALAEWTFGRHAPDRGMIVIKVGNGIGAGIIIEDRLYQGDGFGAGEIGHVSVADNDLPCRCGRTGCLETVASLRAVHARIREAVSGGAGIVGLPTDGLGALAWCQDVVASGDVDALKVIVDAGRAMGRMVGYLVGALDIHDIVLIGLMTEFGEPWLEAVRSEAHRSALRLLADDTRIGLGNVGSDAVELGAAALLMTAELGLSQAA